MGRPFALFFLFFFVGTLLCRVLFWSAIPHSAASFRTSVAAFETNIFGPSSSMLQCFPAFFFFFFFCLPLQMSPRLCFAGVFSLGKSRPSDFRVSHRAIHSFGTATLAFAKQSIIRIFPPQPHPNVPSSSFSPKPHPSWSRTATQTGISHRFFLP